jgi:hypothetical protein
MNFMNNEQLIDNNIKATLLPYECGWLGLVANAIG